VAGPMTCAPGACVGLAWTQRGEGSVLQPRSPGEARAAAAHPVRRAVRSRPVGRAALFRPMSVAAGPSAWEGGVTVARTPLVGGHSVRAVSRLRVRRGQPPWPRLPIRELGAEAAACAVRGPTTIEYPNRRGGGPAALDSRSWQRLRAGWSSGVVAAIARMTGLGPAEP
jgi:hypothetical protein